MSVSALSIHVLRTALKLLAASAIVLFLAGLPLLMHVRAEYYANVSVTLAVRYAEAATHYISEHYARKQAFPAKLSELQLPDGESGYAPRLALDAVTGELTVDIESEHGNYGSLRFLPTRGYSESTRWHCQNVSVEVDLLPSQCSQR